MLSYNEESLWIVVWIVYCAIVVQGAELFTIDLYHGHVIPK